MATSIDINAWQQVPARVSELLPKAAAVCDTHYKAALAADILPLASVTWAPETNEISVYTPVDISDKRAGTYANHFPQSVTFQKTEKWSPDWTYEVLIKRASIPGVKHVFELGNKAMLGPTPLSNGVVSALMMGGLGYGTGALAEQLFPARYLERGKLRRNLGRLGMLTGAGIGLSNAYANAQALKEPFIKSIFTKNTTPVDYSGQKAATIGGYGYNPAVGVGGDDSSMYASSVPVPQFNTALWRDVHKGMINPYGPYGSHTPPPIAAAATGLMNGLSTGLGTPIIRPIDVVRGLASAGVGLATANIAGRTLSALAGLTPEAQNHLQNLGLWGGMMHAVIPPVFGR